LCYPTHSEKKAVASIILGEAERYENNGTTQPNPFECMNTAMDAKFNKTNVLVVILEVDQYVG